MTTPTFEQELYDVVRKWNPSPDFAAFTVIIETERRGRVFDSKTAGISQGGLQPAMQLRYFYHKEWWRDGEKFGDFSELQQLWRSPDGQEEWRAVPTEL